jgi:hypothetical protein
VWGAGLAPLAFNRSFSGGIHSAVNRPLPTAASLKYRRRFLLAELQINSLATRTNRRELREALYELPKRLDEKYRMALDRISDLQEKPRKLTETILSWLLHAFRLLTVKELQHSLAVRAKDTMLYKDGIIRNEEFLVSVYAGLVIVDPQSRNIRLAHHTT